MRILSCEKFRMPGALTIQPGDHLIGETPVLYCGLPIPGPVVGMLQFVPVISKFA